MKYLFLIGVLFSSSFALANRESGGVGSLEQVNCQGRLADGTAVKFEIRGTAVPTFTKGLLQVADSNGTSVPLRCNPGSDVVEGVPTAGSVEWSCSEYRHVDDGDISIELVRAGVTGILTGTIKQKQMFPLPPKSIGKLVCR